MDKSSSRDQNKSGVTQNKLSSGNEFEAWILHHQHSAIISLKKLWAEKTSSLLTCLVIGMALALPTSLLLAIGNIKLMAERWDGEPQLSVYLRQDLSKAAALVLAGKLEQMNGIKTIKYISPDAALEEFKQNSNFKEALQLIDENPLPAVYSITPSSHLPDDISTLINRLQSIPEVESVQSDLQWVQKLQQIVVLAERLALLFGILLSIGVLLTIGNTIRLAIENRREEIVVVKLIGATDAYVTRPFLYSGLWLGLIGALFACVLILLGTYYLKAPLFQLIGLYQSDFLPENLGMLSVLGLLLIGSLLGVVGAWLAVAQQLNKVQPH